MASATLYDQRTRRAIDTVLVLAAAAGLAIGIYRVGHLVLGTSHAYAKAAAQTGDFTPGPARTAAAAPAGPRSQGLTRGGRLGLAGVSALLAVVIVSTFVGSFRRFRRRRAALVRWQL